MSCWTSIEREGDDFYITCVCGWSGFALSYEEAVVEAREHKEESYL